MRSLAPENKLSIDFGKISASPWSVIDLFCLCVCSICGFDSQFACEVSLLCCYYHLAQYLGVCSDNIATLSIRCLHNSLCHVSSTWVALSWFLSSIEYSGNFSKNKNKNFDVYFPWAALHPTSECCKLCPCSTRIFFFFIISGYFILTHFKPSFYYDVQWETRWPFVLDHPMFRYQSSTRYRVLKQ